MVTKQFASIAAGLIAIMLFAGGCGNTSTDPSKTTASIKGQENAQGVPNDSKPTEGFKNTAYDPRHPEVVLETDFGPITIRLFADKAQITVENFLSYVNAHYYDRTVFHQVFKNQGIIAGAYAEDYSVKQQRIPIYNEASNGLKNVRGTVAMVREPGDQNSATSVFLINVVDNPMLDFTERTPEGYGYCVFGEVVKGMEAVDSIKEVEVKDSANLPSTPVQRVLIKSAKQTK
jgi:cyclophilin family peptidyl-prolyl cis-trans isomerase